jgi:Leucine rich repeat/Leucine Rich repeat
VTGRTIHCFCLKEPWPVESLPDLPFEHGLELEFDLPNGFVKGLAALRNLRHITFLGDILTDVIFGELAGLPHLEGLSLIRCRRVTDAGISVIARLKNLRTIRLFDSSLTGDYVKHLGRLEKLTSLGLSNIGDDILMQIVARLNNLQDLDLSYGSVTGAGLKGLAGSKHLRRLNLSYSSMITDADLQELDTLKSLREIDLSGCTTITNVGVHQTVNALANLESLELRGTKITDAVVADLNGLAKLRHLSVWGCGGVTDASVKHLASLRHLDSLDVRNTNITEKGAVELMKAIPNCETTPIQPPIPAG